MGFNVKEYILPPGTLIRFDTLGFDQRLTFTYHSLGVKPGDIGLILKHKKPMLADILIGDRVHHICFENMVDLIGWVSEFTPIYCGSGLREYPRWYPDHCYDEL